MSFGGFDRTRLREGFGRDEALRLLEAGVSAVDPERLVREALQREGDILRIGGPAMPLRGGRAVVIAIGKGSRAMARAAAGILGDALCAGVLVLPPEDEGLAEGGYTVYRGGHPLPDSGSVAAAEAIERLAADVSSDDVVLCLLSGGGSALAAAPAGDLTLDDLRETTRLLLGSGAAITEMNVVRRHLARLSGGRLARLLEPARVATLAVSDVVGDDAETLASGPTVPDPTTFEDARGVLVRHRLWTATPSAVRELIERGVRGDAADTVKHGDSAFARATFHLVGGSWTFVDAVTQAAWRGGWDVRRHPKPVVGAARAAGQAIGREMARFADEVSRPTVWVGAGETAVRVAGTGKGGRNQEAALAAAVELAGVERASVAWFATDGVDGPTDAAGALVDGETVARAVAAGCSPAQALETHDSYPLLLSTGDLLFTGSTGTNVADVFVGIVEPARSGSTSTFRGGI